MAHTLARTLKPQTLYTHLSHNSAGRVTIFLFVIIA